MKSCLCYSSIRSFFRRFAMPAGLTAMLLLSLSCDPARARARKAFAAVKVGMTREDVLQHAGAPDIRTDDAFGYETSGLLYYEFRFDDDGNVVEKEWQP